MRFRGRRALWFLILASFMIPMQALIISHFFLMYNFGLINTWLGVILPQFIAPVSGDHLQAVFRSDAARIP